MSFLLQFYNKFLINVFKIQLKYIFLKEFKKKLLNSNLANVLNNINDSFLKHSLKF